MDFDKRFLDDLRAAVKVSEIVGRKHKLKREGQEHVLADDPSIGINDRKQAWFDNGSHKESGDIFQWLVAKEGFSFPDAVAEVARMAGIALPNSGVPGGGSRRPAQDHERVSNPSSQSARRDGKSSSKTVAASYDYTDENGFLIYQVVRFDPKGFSQRRPRRQDDDPRKVDRDGMVWNLQGVEHTLYRLPALRRELAEPREEQRTCFLMEGERDVHTMLEWNMVATTNSGGAANFSEAMAREFAGAADVVLCEDNDAAGAARTAQVAPLLLAQGARVRVLKIADHWPACPDKGDLTDWRNQGGGNVDRLFEILDRLPDWAPEPYRSRFGAKTWADLDHAPTPYEWSIKGLIPRRENVLIIGPSRSGKTFKTLDLAMHIVRGLPYMGRRVMPGGVVYLSYEGQAGFEFRLRAYLRYHQLDVDHTTPFSWLTRPPGLYASEDNVTGLADEIGEVVKGWPTGTPLAAIVIDTHNSATRGSSEIKSEDISRILDRYDLLSAKAGAPLWIVGHTNAAGAHRGNEQVFNRIETTILVERVIEGRGQSAMPKYVDGRALRRVSIEKQREGADGVKWTFTLHRIEIGTDRDGDPITSMVPVIVDAATGGEVPDEPQTRAAKGSWHASPKESAFFQALLKARDQFGAAAPAELSLPASVGLVVKWADIATVYKAERPVDDDTEVGRRGRWRDIVTDMRKGRDGLLFARVIEIAHIGEDSQATAPVHYLWPTGRPVAGPKGFRWPPPPPEPKKEPNVIDMTTGRPIETIDPLY